ncbi:cupin domain-containing protein [Streptomyces sp. OE57]|uniref:cupin domain-containing protein n=1 Tax=Streptomyces lacaronensis TaxID=3379885 RepID=UPI0039B73E59
MIGADMATQRFTAPDPLLDAFYSQLSEHSLQPLWELSGLLTSQPRVAGVPAHWPGRTLKALAERAGELVPVDRGGDRRVLACCNPGLGGAPYAVSTLWAAVQYLRGHEVAPAHRHTPAALRFIVAGEGVWTLVDGDPLHMGTGDLILTPSWTFHEHHNPTGDPMIWLDVLDLPVVSALDAVFFEEGPSEQPDTRVAERSASEAFFGGGPGLVPVDAPGTSARRSPLLAYRWRDTDRALDALLDTSGGTHAFLRYSDPVHGGDVLPTMRCEIMRVRAGHSSDLVRQTGGRVLCVLHGDGEVAVGSQRYPLAPGDVVAVPSWTAWSLRASDELDVFSTSDAPVLEALDLMRTENLSRTAGGIPSAVSTHDATMRPTTARIGSRG